MGHNFDSPLQDGWIPSTVTHLTFGFQFGFSTTLQKGWIPPSITHLEFGENLKTNLSPEIIPTSVTHLTLPISYMCNRTVYIFETPYLTMQDSPVKHDISLTKSSIPSVTHLTYSSVNSLHHKNPFPVKLYDQLCQFTRVTIQMNYPFNYFPEHQPTPRLLVLQKIDASTVAILDQCE
eukprot:gene16995-20225_t